MKKTLIIGVALILLIAGCSSNKVKKEKVDYIQTKSGLKYRILQNGEGQSARVGNRVYVHYTGWLMDGKKFDSSRDRNQPFIFPLGQRKVIKGWEEGVEGMKIGEKRELIIPPNLGYGGRKVGPIPANSILKFEIELLRIK